MGVVSGGGGIPVTFTAGNGSPNGVVTSAVYGDLYCDTHNGALYVYVGDDAPSPWVIASGDVDPSNVTDGGAPEGVGKSFGTNQLRIVGAAGKSVLLTDRAGLAGTGNGFFWNDQNAADGSQRLVVVTGAGNKIVVLADANGTLGAPPGGIKFPTADPHIVGAWWDNAGTLTRSAG